LFADLGAIDHVVFTAGEPLALMSLATLDPDRARESFNLRYFGTLWAAHAAAPHLNPGGSITLTTGIAGRCPGPGWAVAASICGAVESLTRALAVELAPVRVNAVAPGVVRSPLWASMTPASRDQLYRDTAASIPAGRVGEVDDIARAYLYCLTQPFSTGAILTVDGGTVLA
jgi:NAD(P)-dependent dehydrogenase (short-subunit alcohol dehydrogenase family)